MATATFDLKDTLARLESAAGDKKVSADAVKNIRVWLTEPRYAEYAPQVAEHIQQGKWKELDDVFWTVIPFGTGGRRGKMYPFGSNAINDRTIGESAQGLADYVNDYLNTARRAENALGVPADQQQGRPGCAVAYDTRHRSRHFAELCSEIMAAAGFNVFFLDGFRSTPELSFCVRHKKCACGIMVTASHNPPSDNAVKVYWSTGGQILPPHDRGIIDRVMSTQEIRRVPFTDAVKSGQVQFCQQEVDAAYQAAVEAQSQPGPRDLKLIYSPLHGVGESAVRPVLTAVGFKDFETFKPHQQPDGDFPNVPNHIANPEVFAVFDAIIVRAKEIGADLITATDPDCDRLGVAGPLTLKPGAEWRPMTGNQIGALLADYVLDARRKAGTLSPDHYLVKTLVTSEMIRRIGDSYGVKTFGNLHVGFKYIGATIDEQGPDRFVFGCEESHGFLVGTYARDKDAPVATMLFSEMTARAKAGKQSIHEKLDALFWQHGYHAEDTVSVMMPGSSGMEDMQKLMKRFRTDPPAMLAGMKVVEVLDYLNLTATRRGEPSRQLEAPKGDMVMLMLAEPGNYVAVRPSGTEPKVKFYQFTYVPAEQLANLSDTKREMAERLKALENDLKVFSGVK